ncbi:hypothetical protein KM043_003895 [Ampulex compressa]|nr:hypothetical protein KM043_003895 [Ampulex compressa]
MHSKMHRGKLRLARTSSISRSSLEKGADDDHHRRTCRAQNRPAVVAGCAYSALRSSYKPDAVLAVPRLALTRAENATRTAECSVNIGRFCEALHAPASRIAERSFSKARAKHAHRDPVDESLESWSPRLGPPGPLDDDGVPRFYVANIAEPTASSAIITTAR